MSGKKKKAGGGLTPGQRAKFGPALQASKDEQARRDAPKKMAMALLGKFDGVDNWGEYADALRDCAADINDMLASDEILRIPSRAEYEAEDTAADRAGATMMAMDYRIGMMEAKYLLTMMTALFAAYAQAVRKDPRGTVGLETAKKALKEAMAEDRRLRNKATKKPGRRPQSSKSKWETAFRFIDANADRLGGVRPAAEEAKAKYTMAESVDHIRNMHGKKKKSVISARNMPNN